MEDNLFIELFKRVAEKLDECDECSKSPCECVCDTCSKKKVECNCNRV